MAKGHDTCCRTRLKRYIIKTAQKEAKHDKLWPWKGSKNKEHEEETCETRQFLQITVIMENVKKGLLQDQTFTYSELWTL